MTITQIKYYIAVIENQSFSTAARIHGVSVQAVSKAINDLEKECGGKLFDRFNRGATPTALGRSLYQKALPVLKAFLELEAFADPTSEARIAREKLCIGLCSPVFEHYSELFRSLSAFVKQATDVDVSMVLISPENAQNALDTGELDALISIGTYSNPAVDCVSFGTLLTGIRVTPDHPLANKSMISAEDLAAYPAGESPIYDSFNESIFALYRKRGLLGKTKTVESLAENDFAFMHEDQGYFFSALFPMGDQTESGSKLIPVDPAIAVRVPICLVSLKGNKPARYHEVEQFLKQSVGTLVRK